MQFELVFGGMRSFARVLSKPPNACGGKPPEEQSEEATCFVSAFPLLVEKPLQSPNYMSETPDYVSLQ